MNPTEIFENLTMYKVENLMSKQKLYFSVSKIDQVGL